ncbi:MAG: CHASE3 domain-containing protein [Bacteroidota bacterium]
MKSLQIYKSPTFLKILFVLSIAVIFFIGGVTFKHLTALKKSATSVSNSFEVNMELERLISYLKDAETGQRGYLITKDTSFLTPYYNSKELIKQSFNTISKLSKNNPIQQNNLRKLLFYINKKQNYLSKSIYQVQQDKFSQADIRENLLQGKEVMDSVRLKTEHMIKIEGDILHNRQELYQTNISYTPLFIYLTLLITLTLITIAFIKMNKDLIFLKKSNNELLVVNETSNLAEIVGNFGSWRYNLESNKYTFSDNEYRLLGFEPNAFEASPKEIEKFVYPEDLESYRERSNALVNNNELPAFTYRVTRKDGEIRYFKNLGRIVENQSGSKIFIGTTSDVTDEVFANKFMEERNRELEANNKELTAFNYVASHDLQEPLRKIETFISRLIDKDYASLSEDGQQYLTRIQSSASRMRILIDDLLQFSRTTKTEKVFENADLDNLLENAKQDLGQIIEDKKATIENDELPKLRVIPFQIQQLFVNLLGNSLKYSKDDVAPAINIKSSLVVSQDEEFLPKNKDKYYKISFEDNGIGFEQEYANKIFILFNRLHKRNEYDGTGIGLAICKKIVENHNGYIFAYGQPNIGTKITIYLPVQ